MLSYAVILTGNLDVIVISINVFSLVTSIIYSFLFHLVIHWDGVTEEILLFLYDLS